MKKFSFLALLFGLASCKRDFDAPVPDTTWDLFESAASIPLGGVTRSGMEGIYNITEGVNEFGNMAAFRWSYTITPSDTIYHLSMFFEQDASFVICEGKQHENNILLNGYWRKMSNTETGIIRLTITAANGAEELLSGTTGNINEIIISGTYSIGQNIPDRPVRFEYLRPLYNNTPFQVIAHRGGGRNSDLLPASENSVEMIRLASRLGASGIEIDVRLTSDGVPILYHDNTLNERLIEKNGMLGPIENYNLAQLKGLVRLKRGGQIPTLEEALHTIVHQTPLRFVWLDIKYTGSLAIVRQLQQQALQEAATIGRNLEIMIGVPDEDVLKNFLLLPGFQQIPSLCELDIADAEKMNANIWAPMWTSGLQKEEVAKVQAQGRRAFVWTVDGSDNIRKYMYEGDFDGILSNQPTLVAYHYYARQ